MDTALQHELSGANTDGIISAVGERLMTPGTLRDQITSLAKRPQGRAPRFRIAGYGIRKETIERVVHAIPSQAL
jgi:hypothetical protein